MTLAELSQAWNDLRNAALGRGLNPNVKPATAELIGNAYERWRAWYQKAGVSDDMVASVSAAPMVELYRKTLALAKAEGVKVAELEQTPVERAKPAIGEVKTMVIAGSVAISLLALAYIVGKFK